MTPRIAERSDSDVMKAGWGGSATLQLYFGIRLFSSSQHLIPLARTSAFIHTYCTRRNTQTYNNYCTCMLVGSRMPAHSLFRDTQLIRTEWKMHAVNFQRGLLASFLTLPPPSSLPIPTCTAPLRYLSHISPGQGLSTAWRRLVDLRKLYGADTQLVVGTLTSPEEEKKT